MKAAIVNTEPKSAEIIKPYLRGQDVARWVPEWDGMWMIFSHRGIEIDSYPAVKQHLLQFREFALAVDGRRAGYSLQHTSARFLSGMQISTTFVAHKGYVIPFTD